MRKNFSEIIRKKLELMPVDGILSNNRAEYS
jgi:hypothetical protein